MSHLENLKNLDAHKKVDITIKIGAIIDGKKLPACM
jgi:hypothetical protein